MKTKKVLIVHSKSTEASAKKLGLQYYDSTFLCISGVPSEYTTDISNEYEQVIGVGGGSVIDTAKLISKDKRIIAIPTTAAGACMTTYATVWGESKRSITTKKPILVMPKDLKIKLPITIQLSTMFDALSHSFESLWSTNSNSSSKLSSCLAVKDLGKFYQGGSIKHLISGGNHAGEAIEVTKTNIVHAVSYPLTLKYGISHGLACALVLPYFITYFGDHALHTHFKHRDSDSLVWHLKHMFPYYAIDVKLLKIDWKYVIHKAFRYDKIYTTQHKHKISENMIYEIIYELIKETA